jgi:hypothetical protein
VNSLSARPILGLCLLAAGVRRWPRRSGKSSIFTTTRSPAFIISDMQFPSARRGVAVGVIRDGKREEPSRWSLPMAASTGRRCRSRKPPVSLFFLNENLGWLVTTKGLWQTVEAGRTWTKLPKLPTEIYRVYFLDEKHGWAIGPKKTALETHDGGKTWIALGAAAPEDTAKISTTAPTPGSPSRPRAIGLITGWNIPPRRFEPALPNWVDPDTALRQRETPHLSYTLTTSDAGVQLDRRVGVVIRNHRPRPLRAGWQGLGADAV